VRAQALVADVVVVVPEEDVAVETMLRATYAATEVDSVQLTLVLVEVTAVVLAVTVVAWAVPPLAAMEVARTETHLDQVAPARNHPGGKHSSHDSDSGFFAVTHCVFSYWFL